MKLKKEIEKIVNEPLVRAKYGKCPHCSFKTKSYIVHKNNSIAQHIITNHPEVPDKLDKLTSLFLSYLSSMEEMKEEEVKENPYAQGFTGSDERKMVDDYFISMKAKNQLRKDILNRVKAELKEI